MTTQDDSVIDITDIKCCANCGRYSTLRVPAYINPTTKDVVLETDGQAVCTECGEVEVLYLDTFMDNIESWEGIDCNFVHAYEYGILWSDTDDGLRLFMKSGQDTWAHGFIPETSKEIMEQFDFINWDAHLLNKGSDISLVIGILYEWGYQNILGENTNKSDILSLEDVVVQLSNGCNIEH